jgi:hypothetical protein
MRAPFKNHTKSINPSPQYIPRLPEPIKRAYSPNGQTIEIGGSLKNWENTLTIIEPEPYIPEEQEKYIAVIHVDPLNFKTECASFKDGVYAMETFFHYLTGVLMHIYIYDGETVYIIDAVSLKHFHPSGLIPFMKSPTVKKIGIRINDSFEAIEESFISVYKYKASPDRHTRTKDHGMVEIGQMIELCRNNGSLSEKRVTKFTDKLRSLDKDILDCKIVNGEQHSVLINKCVLYFDMYLELESSQDGEK